MRAIDAIHDKMIKILIRFVVTIISKVAKREILMYLTAANMMIVIDEIEVKLCAKDALVLYKMLSVENSLGSAQ